MTRVTLSLVSHTNAGKTTLARTLLRRDVGSVLDAAHVTEQNEHFTLARAGEHELVLCDTPGLGDSVRLARRLRASGGPLGWFQHAVWDRLRDRPLWCSQEALRNVRDEADLVLYLVNALEDPADAGYLESELDILEWVGKPLLVLLNQTGRARAAPSPAGDDGALSRWRGALQTRAVVRGVLELDAFHRCVLLEPTLFERAAQVLADAPREALADIARALARQTRELFERNVHDVAGFLAETAGEREALPEQGARADKKGAMAALAKRLEVRERALWDRLIEQHGLEGRAAVELASRLENFRVEGMATLSAKRNALWGGAVSGALGGLAADLLAGGLSFGGGLVAGALLGALGGAGLTEGFRLVQSRSEPSVRWSPQFLELLAHRTLLRYLALLHSGRGRGPFREETIASEFDAALARALGSTAELFEAVAREDENSTDALESRCRAALSDVLGRAYPDLPRLLA